LAVYLTGKLLNNTLTRHLGSSHVHVPLFIYFHSKRKKISTKFKGNNVQESRMVTKQMLQQTRTCHCQFEKAKFLYYLLSFENI